MSHYWPSKMQRIKLLTCLTNYLCWNPVNMISTCRLRRAELVNSYLTKNTFPKRESGNPRKSDWDLVLLCWPELWLSLVPALANCRCLCFHLISPIKLVRFWCRRSSLSSPGEAVSGCKNRFFRERRIISSSYFKLYGEFQVFRSLHIR